MIIYKCIECGKEYSRQDKPENEKCINCGAFLDISSSARISSVGTSETKEPKSTLKNRRINSVKANSSVAPTSTNNDSDDNTVISTPKYSSRRNKSASLNVATNSKPTLNTQAPNVNVVNKTCCDYIEGKVVSVSKDEAYRRYFWEKIADKVKYKQHVADVQNTIYLRGTNPDGSVSNTNIIIYGNIKGGERVIQTGMKLRAYGKWNDRNEYIAEKIVCNDSYEISIRTEPQDVLYVMSPLILVAVIGLVFAIGTGVVEIYNKLSWASIALPFLAAFACCFIWGKRSRRPLYFKIRSYIMISLVVEIIWLIIKLSL